MIFDAQMTPREQAQDMAWDAMDLLGGEEKKVVRLCREALAIHPDCVDALSMLAEIESSRLIDYVDAMRKAVAAGRRDLGSKRFKKYRGHFWGEIETRPFMRAMAGLAGALIEWGTPERIDEAIAIQEEMLALNPNDNQGIRDMLVGCYLAKKRYDDAARLLKRYEGDWMAVFRWARVLLAFATGYEDEAAGLVAEARQQNPHVELYLTGKKRRPRYRLDSYSPGEESEAICCADVLWAAWQAHPKAKRWLKGICFPEQ
jgi:tetratricopeptide (TPR) repeat protein